MKAMTLIIMTLVLAGGKLLFNDGSSRNEIIRTLYELLDLVMKNNHFFGTQNEGQETSR